MKIALDYDDTFTKDPEFWTEFYIKTWDDGHEIRIVTARSPNDDNLTGIIPDLLAEDVIYCDGVAKRFHCHWFAKWDPDIWIDDKPQSVDNNSTATKEVLAEWRRNRVA